MSHVRRRAKTFYEALGRRGQEVEETVFFQTGGLGFVWGRDKLAADCGLEPGEPGEKVAGGGFGGIALAHNVRSDAEADELLAAAERAGGTITRPAAVNAVGFYSGAFVDPDGHAWEVAHNPGLPLAEDGSVTIPDFGGVQGLSGGSCRRRGVSHADLRRCRRLPTPPLSTSLDRGTPIASTPSSALQLDAPPRSNNLARGNPHRPRSPGSNERR